MALIPAALFAAFARWSRQRLAWMAAGAWSVYTIYELLMKQRVLCSGECNIRVDLLLVYPVLALLSMVALVAGFARRRGRGA